MDSSPTRPEETKADSTILKRQEPEKLTPSGYKPGGLRASDGTRYEVLPSGQIVRLERKMGKAERKRHKKERRQKVKSEERQDHEG